MSRPLQRSPNSPRLAQTNPIQSDPSPGAPIECDQSNPCSQRCLSAGSLEPGSRRRLERDRCDCFAGFRLAPDGVSCADVDECKLNLHTCNRQSEVCDNTRGSFRCLARHHHLLGEHSKQSHQTGDEPAAGEFVSLRLCPSGSRWNSLESRCQPASLETLHRSASLLAASPHLAMGADPGE